MKLLAPAIFEQFPEMVAAVSLRDETAPGNMSMTKAGTDEETASENRGKFCQELGFKDDQLAHPILTHSDNVHIVKDEYSRHEGDAVMTVQPEWLLGVTVADCAPVLMYDPESGFYAAIHSGWRGSALNITDAAISKAMREFHIDPRNVYAWIGPAASSESYEVGYDVVNQFNPRYSQPKEADKWLFDNKSVVRDQLLNSGIEPDKIEICGLDTITNQELHSARRDGEQAGRMLVAIGMHTEH